MFLSLNRHYLTGQNLFGVQIRFKIWQFNLSCQNPDTELRVRHLASYIKLKIT
jgi:hypothetical protein